MNIQTLLVANRGEIARRIFRTARRMGLRTVAVCSEADASAPFAQEADEHHVIGPANPRESYLKVDAILDAAKKAKADAIHPGYGFLAENPGFADRVRGAGLVFVGPSSDSIRRVGGKLHARRLAEQAGVPVIPGSGAVRSLDEAAAFADSVGYPVIVKASAGGGGIGMTVVKEAKRLERGLTDARKKGESFFGNDEVYIEKFVESPAHVEVQIFGDVSGRVVALGDRDCTVQRRNQKVIEEAPSPRLTDATRTAMLEAAERLGKAADYVNAGTVEMITAGAGPDAGSFYFLEVNSRLQVEHPVTEMVTGLDLVELQLRVADGDILPLDLRAGGRGHAIEARVCAEDPDQRFIPRPGPLGKVSFPDMEHVRVDSGVESGSLVTPNYDSLLAKVVAWGDDRDQALDRLRDALAATVIDGKTNLSLFPRVLDHPTFRRGDHDTSFLLSELGLKS
jgi:acetyl/propionyl-CoA carboxylase alpha subunit